MRILKCMQDTCYSAWHQAYIHGDYYDGLFPEHLFLNLAGGLQGLLLERQYSWVDSGYNTSQRTILCKVNNPTKSIERRDGREWAEIDL